MDIRNPINALHAYQSVGILIIDAPLPKDVPDRSVYNERMINQNSHQSVNQSNQFTVPAEASTANAPMSRRIGRPRRKELIKHVKLTIPLSEYEKWSDEAEVGRMSLATYLLWRLDKGKPPSIVSCLGIQQWAGLQGLLGALASEVKQGVEVGLMPKDILAAFHELTAEVRRLRLLLVDAAGKDDSKNS